MLQADRAVCRVGHSCSQRNSKRGLTLGLRLASFLPDCISYPDSLQPWVCLHSHSGCTEKRGAQPHCFDVVTSRGEQGLKVGSLRKQPSWAAAATALHFFLATQTTALGQMEQKDGGSAALRSRSDCPVKYPALLELAGADRAALGTLGIAPSALRALCSCQLHCFGSVQHGWAGETSAGARHISCTRHTSVHACTVCAQMGFPASPTTAGCVSAINPLSSCSPAWGSWAQTCFFATNLVSCRPRGS